MNSAAFARDRWSDRWFNFRNRMLASRWFQHRAAAFALTRPAAQRSARSLFDLIAGFVYSQVLLACVRLHLFDLLAEGPQGLEVLCARLRLSDEACTRLLSAALSLDLVERRPDGRYGLGLLGAPMVGNQAIAALIEHHSALYLDLADPVALLRGQHSSDRLAGYWPYAGAAEPGALPAEQVAAYSTLMTSSQSLVAGEILDAWPISGYRCLLDIGGGEGEFLRQAGLRAPGLSLRLFDLPAVVERAHQRMAACGLGARCHVFGGDFLRDALPPGADIASLVRVIHDHDDSQAATLLKAARLALQPGGTLLLAEPMAGTAGAEPMGDAYFGFYLLAMGAGKPRTPARLTTLLQEAGFQAVRLLPTRMPLQTSVLVARA
jgi:demethylspheroidene O-methyltransferase